MEPPDAWERTARDRQLGVVIHSYDEGGPCKLELHLGDTVHIIGHCQGWYYGYRICSPNDRGVFPQGYIHLRQPTTGTNLFEAQQAVLLVEEMTSVLREWGRLWKQLFVKVEGAATANFDSIRQSMVQLIDWRRTIMAAKLTQEEIKKLQQKVTCTMDHGNALLGQDLVVRDNEGNLVDPSSTSTISLYKQHAAAAEKLLEERDGQKKQVPQLTANFNLFVNVENFVCHIGEEADVYISLFDPKIGEFISDHYILKWGNQGLPKDLDLLHNLRVIFTDLGAQDSSRDRVYLVCQIIRIGRMDLKEPDSKKQSHGLRRPFGVAVMDITESVKGNSEMYAEKTFFIPFQPCGERETMESMIRKAVVAKDINNKGQGLYLTLRKLHGDLAQAQKEYPFLISGTMAVARKMGFPDVILPSDVRNDLYVNLRQGEFKKGSKMSDKNVEVTMCVCDHEGHMLENVISEGAGGQMLTHCTSVIYYHEDKPRWFETIKVVIPINDFYGSHLKFSFKHRSSSEAKDRSEKPFAMSYIKLMNDNGTTLGDTNHELLVYKVDNRSAENIRIGDYGEVPSTMRELERRTPPGVSPRQYQHVQKGALQLSSMDNFQISTLVCSTKLTHNVELMGLLKWRDNPAGLKHHLLAFMKVDGEEVVKFIPDTLDALFNILMQNSDSDTYDNLVFEALIFVVGVVSDRKYSQFRPVLHVYIKENFSATLAYNKLLAVLRWYIDAAREPGHQDMVLKAMKSLEYVFRFITRSRILFAALNEDRGQQQFELILKQVFTSLCNLMSHPADSTRLIRAAVLKYLPTSISDIISVLDPVEFSHMLEEFVNSMTQGQLIRMKIQFFDAIVHSVLFQITNSRHMLVPLMLQQVKSLMEKDAELDVCVIVLGDILHELFSLEESAKINELNILCTQILRTLIQTVIRMDKDAALYGNTVAVLTSMLRQMTEFHYTNYIDQFEERLDLTDFLMEILQTLQELIRTNVYPSDWYQMIMVQNSVFLRSLGLFSVTIKQRYANPFDRQVWHTFFHCTITFLAQDALQLERFSSTKRNSVLAKYRDMRRESGFELCSMWYHLGVHRSNFIPSMVGPILQMTLIPEPELRKTTIPIFYDMISCEFFSTLQARNPRLPQQLLPCEHELITQLDAMVGSGLGDYQYRDLFYAILQEKFLRHCSESQELQERGVVFVETLKDLLQHLLEYRDVINEENRDNRMSCTVNLLNFYHSISRQELYIRYLHKLCELHLQSDNFTEAAMTLMLYAKLLKWSDESLPPSLENRKHPHSRTHRELKRRLYTDIIDYFDRGKMWEKGLELSEELASQYKTETFDYLALATLLSNQATFYKKVMNPEQQPTLERHEPQYFRVGYYGLGAPAFLQNKVFIYRGNAYEKLSDFSAQIQNLFPSAQLMKSLVPPTDDIKNSPNHYLQINAVTPILELKQHLQGKKVSDQIVKYYKFNEVQKFTFTRKKQGHGSDLATMWLERTTLVTSFPFPGILRWFPVSSTYTIDVSPLENALETMEKTNTKIKALINRHRLQPQLEPQDLGMTLNGVVDAAVNGGIANFKTFYTEEYIEDNAGHTDLVQKLRNCTALQLLLLQQALEIHKLKASEKMQVLQKHMETRFSQMKDYIEKEYGIKHTDEMRSVLNKELAPCPLPAKRVVTMPPESNLHNNKLWQTMPIRHIRKRMSKADVFPGRASAAPLTPRISAQRSNSITVVRESATKVYSRAVSNISMGQKSDKDKDRDTHEKAEADLLTMTASSLSLDTTGSSPNNAKDKKRRNSTSSKSERSSVKIELNQELTPMRPKRPESSSRSRPNSGLIFPLSLAQPSPSINAFNQENYSPDRGYSMLSPAPPAPPVTSNLSGSGLLGMSVDEFPDYDEPPPLPVKQATSDYANLDEMKEAMQEASVLKRLQSVKQRLHLEHRDKLPPPLPVTDPPHTTSMYIPAIPPKSSHELHRSDSEA